MSTRSQHIDQFLAEAGWNNAQRKALAGDASFRRYERITHEGKRAVLMDAPPQKEDVRPFMRIAARLAGHGLSAPRILASDASLGLLLLEDLGDDLFARVLEREPAQEKALYLAAADVLADLYRHTASSDHTDITVYDMPRFLQQVALLPEWFLPLVTSREEAQELSTEYLELWQEILSGLPDIGRTLIMYDFHAENLLWLPDRNGSQRVGLLDFQDAVIGSPAYDMVSFLEDARRDVAAQTVSQVIDHFLVQTNIDRNDFMTAYAMLGAQRNCRIVGTFARLAIRDGKKHYLSYMPRVWGHLARDLRHPALAPLRQWLDEKVQPQWRGVLNIDEAKARAEA